MIKKLQRSLGEVSMKLRRRRKKEAQLKLAWAWLTGIRIPRLVWGSFLLLFSTALGWWLIRNGYRQKWTGWENKTLWDWMKLLIVPLSLALIAYLFSRQERKIDREIAAEQYQQRLLQDYLDRLSKLLLDKADELQPESRIAVVAQVLTLTVLRQSDVVRRAAILRFLNEAKLIQNGRKIVDLNGAELSEAALPGVNLEEVDLRGAILEKCDLRNAILRKANLDHTTLNGSKFDHADLSQAHLNGAKMTRCNLTEARLFDARLEGTDLNGSNLSKACLQGAYFAGAIFKHTILKGIHYNDRTTWPSKFQPPADAFNISKYWRDSAAKKKANQASQTEDSSGGGPPASSPTT